jgi:hypothetical protein
MKRTAAAIREAADKGGYGYRWWKVHDNENGVGYNALPMRALTTVLSGRHSGRHGTGRTQVRGLFTGTVSSITLHPARTPVGNTAQAISSCTGDVADSRLTADKPCLPFYISSSLACHQLPTVHRSAQLEP